MLDTIFATKGGMTQVWTKQGKRMPVTRCVVDENVILGKQQCLVTDRSSAQFTQKPHLILEIGYGKKKLKNTPKPLRTIIEKSGFSCGFKQIQGVRVAVDGDVQSASFQDKDKDNKQQDQLFQIGEVIPADKVLSIGDVVKVQGISKGHGFAGVVKRYGMRGGPKTRGQSDRHRAVGSIGGQTPGKVWKGKRMPGHYGVDKVTVANLTVVHLDPETREVWLSGPVPGHLNSIIRITKTGQTKQLDLDKQASGIKEEKKVEAQAETPQEQSNQEASKEEKQVAPEGKSEKKQAKKENNK